MIKGLYPIPIKELKALSGPKSWVVKGNLKNIPSLMPISGEMSAEHKGRTLLIKGYLHTVINLLCDRCQNQFDQTLTFNGDELIWIDSKNHLGEQSNLDELIEYLDPLGCFDPERWVFEQLSLQMPLIKHCGKDCLGIPLETEYLWVSLRREASINFSTI